MVQAFFVRCVAPKYKNLQGITVLYYVNNLLSSQRNINH